MNATYLPGIVAAKYVTGYVLDVSFNDGTRKSIDLSQWFKGPVFESLHKKAFFKKFFVEAGMVAWPNGVDIAPEALYEAENVSAPAAVRRSERGSEQGHRTS